MTKKIEELRKKLEDLREAREKEEEAQLEKDLEAQIELESEHGALVTVKPKKYVSGQPTFALVRTPTSSEYKRFKAMVASAGEGKARAKKVQEAGELLAKVCWVYPQEEEDRGSMLEVFPGLLTSMGIVAAKLAEGDEADEGKG